MSWFHTVITSYLSRIDIKLSIPIFFSSSACILSNRLSNIAFRVSVFSYLSEESNFRIIFENYDNYCSFLPQQSQLVCQNQLHQAVLSESMLTSTGSSTPYTLQWPLQRTFLSAPEAMAVCSNHQLVLFVAFLSAEGA